MWFFSFCFKHKTADEVGIVDWSSVVCSSDLIRDGFDLQTLYPGRTRGADRGGQASMVRCRAAVAFELFVRRHRELAEGHAGHAPDARQLDDLGQRQWRDR